MASRSLADLLEDFGARPRVREVAPAVAMAPVAVVPPPPPPPAIDVDAIVAAEVERTEARLRAEFQAEHDAVMEAERATHRAELDALAKRLGADAGTRITTGLADLETRVTDLTTQSVARILAGAMSDSLQRRSIDALAATIRSAIADKDAVRIKVRGPQSLSEPLLQSLGGLGDRLDLSDSADLDLTVSIDGTLYETRLAEWSAAIGETLS